LIPERTIDGWTVRAVDRVFPGSSVWLPTLQQQRISGAATVLTDVLAGREPWDVLVGDPGSKKVFMLENKALRWDGASVLPIDNVQLAALEVLESCGVPVYYGLPVPKWTTLPAVGRANLERQPDMFEDWHRVVLPSDLRKEVGKPTRRIEEMSCLKLAATETLADFKAPFLECDRGAYLSRMNDLHIPVLDTLFNLQWYFVTLPSRDSAAGVTTGSSTHG
jgi:hypothetical protein